MSWTDWAVVAGGLAAIAWVNWYFFLAARAGVRGGTRRDERSDRGAQHGNDRP